jgi:putative endonuclease
MTRSTLKKRQKALLWGHIAEWLAVLWLMAKGYRILARRYASRSGEVDIIAFRKNTIAFVEVKARGDVETGLAAITPEKINRFGTAVDAWLMRHEWASAYVLRCDAIIVRPFARPYHIEDAFSLPFA